MFADLSEVSHKQRHQSEVDCSAVLDHYLDLDPQILPVRGRLWRLPAGFCQSETLPQHTSNQCWRAIVTLVQISMARNERPKSAKTRPTKISQVTYLTHSTCTSARAQLYQPKPRYMGTLLSKREAPALISSPAMRLYVTLVYAMLLLYLKGKYILSWC